MTDHELQAMGAQPMPRALLEQLQASLQAVTAPIMAIPGDQPHGYLRQGRTYVVVRGLPSRLEGVEVDRAWLRRCWPELEEIGSWFSCGYCGGQEAVPARLLRGRPGSRLEDEWVARGMAFQ